MRFSARALNRATLARQLLLERAPLDVETGMRRVVAIQAQEPASPYIALWARLADFDAADLDQALARAAIVKASLMRITLHAVAATDYLEFHRAMQSTLRGSRLYDPRFTVTDVPSDEVDALVPDLLAFAAEPRSNGDVEAWLDERLGPGRGRQVWWAVRTFAPFRHAATSGPWSFGPRPAYVATPPPHERDDPATALPALIRRYLAGFGPATVADIAQFTLIQRWRVKDAVETMGDGLVRHDGADGSDGRAAGTLLDVADGPAGLTPDEATPAPPRLLPMWDSILFAYADRSRVIPPAFRSHVIRRNGDTLPTLLVDGHVAGVWRPTPDGIEATAFEPLSDDAWEGLETEARSLLELLATRDPKAYGRYGRWWSELPAAEVRVLARRQRFMTRPGMFSHDDRDVTRSTAPRIVPANEATWDDIQAIFGVRGPASWCRCQWYKTASRTWDGQAAAMVVEERAWQLRVQTAADHPESPVTSGLVAYVDGEPAGWVAVEPRTAYPRLQRKRLVWKDRPDEDKADTAVWALTCFVVRVGFRRRGLMLALARAAIDFARERGARALEAYPMRVDDGQDVVWGELFVGKDTVLAEAGFQEVTHPTPRRSVMRVDFDDH